MTMDEISELVKAVKETSQTRENTTTESRGRILFLIIKFSYIISRTSTTCSTTRIHGSSNED
jgi:hypothetical protein